jgi:hypothetical protein
LLPGHRKGCPDCPDDDRSQCRQGRRSKKLTKIISGDSGDDEEEKGLGYAASVIRSLLPLGLRLSDLDEITTDIYEDLLIGFLTSEAYASGKMKKQGRKATQEDIDKFFGH